MMMRSTLPLSLLLLLVACGDDGDNRPTDDGGPMVETVLKAGFTGRWWYTQTVASVGDTVDWDLDLAAVSLPWVGRGASFDGHPGADVLTIEWVIREDRLEAFTVSDDAPRRVASFPIEAHVDPVVEGEEPSEPERPWYDREAMVVGWSEGELTAGDLGGDLDDGELFVQLERTGRSLGAVRFDSPADDPRTGEPREDALSLALDASEQWTAPDCERCGAPFAVAVRHTFERTPPDHAIAAEVAPTEPSFARGVVPGEPSLVVQPGLFAEPLGDAACATDADCDGASCDPIAGRCQRPVGERSPRPLRFHLAPDFPPHLVRSAFEAVARWNEAVMTGARAAAGEALPEQAPTTCQDSDPMTYCYCGGSVRAPEVRADDTCEGRSDPFTAPEERGATAPFDCQVTGPADDLAPSGRESYDDEVYGYRFTGSECALTLAVNPCNDPETPDAACVEAGDPRYLMLSVPDADRPECAASSRRVDGRTGEVLGGAIAVMATCLDDTADYVARMWEVIRGERPESELWSLDGADGTVDRLDAVTSWAIGLERRAVPADELLGPDQMADLAGTSPERTAAAPFGDSAADAWRELAPFGERDDLARTSPARGAQRAFLLAAHERAARLRRAHVQTHRTAFYAPHHHRYLARAFEGRPAAEAAVRWRQGLFRALAGHQLGHLLGLEHQLAGTAQRDHYPASYFEQVVRPGVDGPLVFQYPTFLFQPIDEDESFREGWPEDEARERARQSAGLGLSMSASVMDVAGDLSDFAGPGRADVAAIAAFPYRQQEVFLSDPTIEGADGSSLEGLLRSDTTERAWRPLGADRCAEDPACTPVRYVHCDTDAAFPCLAGDSGGSRVELIMSMVARTRGVRMAEAGGASIDAASAVAAAIVGLAELARVSPDQAPEASHERRDRYRGGGAFVTWLGELATAPTAGTYSLNADTGMLLPDGEDATTAIELGTGVPDNTTTEWLRALSLRALTLRDWGSAPGRGAIADRAQLGVSELLGALMADAGSGYAPALTDGVLRFEPHARGTALSATTGQPEPAAPGRLDLLPSAVPRPRPTAIDDLRAFAASLVAADPVLGWGLAVFIPGSATAMTIPDVQRDGEPTRAFGAALPGSGHAITTDPLEADYAYYQSGRFEAVAARSSGPSSRSFEPSWPPGYLLVLRLLTIRDEISALESLPMPSPEETAQLARLRDRQRDGETVLRHVLQLRAELR